mgnify:CR=1 FL=1
MNRQRKVVEQQSRDWSVVPAQRVSSEVTRIIVHSNEAIGTAAGNEAAQAINGKSLKTALNTGEKRTPAVSRRNAISNITNLNNSSDNTELALDRTNIRDAFGPAFIERKADTAKTTTEIIGGFEREFILERAGSLNRATDFARGKLFDAFAA